MKAQNLIASVAAVLLTAASLSAVNYNVASQPTHASRTEASSVTDLAPIQVSPSAAEMRSAALLANVGSAGIATVPSMVAANAGGNTEQLSLLGSQLAMPYYSFGNKFGRISKE
ncbi:MULTISPECIES: hypothetical protein [Rhodanobacter]|uniref:Uncharacterized protein n=1 Tax=Rhodanobacter denitrificans TaxID=666685 RepID=I4WVC3_9GAMM|nr:MULTISPECIES: hypothetical protein [Rhodanobacter]AGG88658.1 hypothetical protein R2APBS1_1514 [Rhodanobacter denitrificans]EIM03415.1 hypothetical protein UUC_07001 [Rhodanobacter denitrificans]KZC20457.1 hypothetical protein RHOFW104R3_25625 [Rhodanobacter denitrificans]UJJ52539.1 hypothetical protein LRK52_07595 [Rhodanobacter denitrificans]UJJ58675.1 hypothetical protein LRK55_00630 [Rhodanobacter denitrificans]